MNDESFIIGSCGVGGFFIAAFPTILLVLSEVLGLSSGKSNGIVHFIYCIFNKIIKKEPVTSEDVLQCLKKVEEVVEEVVDEEKTDNDIETGISEISI